MRNIANYFDPTISNEALVDLCETDNYIAIGNSELGARIGRITKDAVIKFGVGVTSDEASNQSFVYEHADPSTLRVPKVLRFFEDNSNPKCGYLVMEYIEGVVLENVDSDKRPRLSNMITRALKHLWELPIPPGHAPGPLDGGPPKVYVWSDDGASTGFRSVCEMEAFINNYLFRFHLKRGGSLQIPQLDLHHAELVMCHTDLASRNIISLPDGGVCFLDWAFGGVYPKVFELYSLAARLPWEPEHFGAILRDLGITYPWADPEIAVLDKFNRAITIFVPPKSPLFTVCCIAEPSNGVSSTLPDISTAFQNQGMRIL